MTCGIEMSSKILWSSTGFWKKNQAQLIYMMIHNVCNRRYNLSITVILLTIFRGMQCRHISVWPLSNCVGRDPPLVSVVWMQQWYLYGRGGALCCVLNGSSCLHFSDVDYVVSNHPMLVSRRWWVPWEWQRPWGVCNSSGIQGRTGGHWDKSMMRWMNVKR